MGVSKLLISLLAVFSVMFFVAGCSDDPKTADDESNINVPNEPGGSVGEDQKAKDAIDSLPNAAVSQQNLEEFISELMASLRNRNNWWYSYSSERTTRNLPEEYQKMKYSENYDYKTYGDFSGRVEIVGKSGWGYDDYGNGEVEYKFFDYSNNGTLFLGGELGTLWSSEHYIAKFNGTIEFRGSFTGKIVFNNITLSSKLSYYYEIITSGSFFVESNGSKVNLPDWLLNAFYPYSDSIDYGNARIDTTMPSVPSAPNGKLNERGGDAVVESNKEAFFAALKSEFYNNIPRSIRSTNEESEEWEKLRHGENNGYYIEKSTLNKQVNNSDSYNASTRTMEYSDYSNLGVLFFGGGYGRADYYGEYYLECKLNGRVYFNGVFNGTLDFQNFHYKEDRSLRDAIYTHISGKVILGSLDVTNDYVRYVLRNEHISLPPTIDNRLVGTWKYFSEEYPVEFYYIFNSDGTGTEIHYEYNYDYVYSYDFSWHVKGFSVVDIDGYSYSFSVSENNMMLFGHWFGFGTLNFSKYTGTLPTITENTLRGAIPENMSPRLKERLLNRKE